MPRNLPLSVQATAFRASGVIATVNLASVLADAISLPFLACANVAVVGAMVWRIARLADGANERNVLLQRESRRVLEEYLTFAQRLAMNAIRQPGSAYDYHVARVEIVRRFFSHAKDLNVTRDEMDDLLRTADPIVVADVVRELTRENSPLLNERLVPWSALVISFAGSRSQICHRPIDLQAWNQSLHPASSATYA